MESQSQNCAYNNVVAAVDAASSRPSAVVFLGPQVFDGGESGPRESPESIPMSNSAFNDGIRTTNMYVRVWGVFSYFPRAEVAAGQVR